MRIEHDFHIHTTLSLCCRDPQATVESYIAIAKELGIRKLGFSNHFWDGDIPGASGFYAPQDLPHVAEIRADIAAAAKNTDIGLYYGCEVEFDTARRDIAVTEEHAKQFDYILVPNSHTHMIMPRELIESKQKHADFMMDVFMDTVRSPLAKYITAVAHPFNAVACPYDNRELYGLISEERYREAFLAAKAADIALEINVSCFKGMTQAEVIRHPAMDMFRVAKECGCKFIFGSDAHTVAENGPHGMWGYAYTAAAILELTEDDIADIAK